MMSDPPPPPPTSHPRFFRDGGMSRFFPDGGMGRRAVVVGWVRAMLAGRLRHLERWTEVVSCRRLHVLYARYAVAPCQ